MARLFNNRLNQKRVLLALGWYDYRLHRGVEKYAQEHGWYISEDSVREKAIPWGWEGDGILTWLGPGDELADFVVKSRKPTVDFSFRRAHLNFPRVLEDNAAIGQQVAEHFLGRGFERFMYYSDSDNWVHEERGEGFIQALKHAGHKCDWLRWHRSSDFNTGRHQWKHKRMWLAAHMKRLRKPLALFCVTDGRALEALESCERAGIAVPEEVAIVGACNSMLSPETMPTPITSVDTNLELVGYRGAALLDKLMQGKASPPKPIRVPPGSLIVRKSSDLIAVNHKGVANSLRFLWEHCHELVGVEDMAKSAAMSRRAFHRVFMQYLGRPPGQELHRIRIERAKQLLVKSSDKLNTIAEQCGYQSTNSFGVAFKQTTGKSPKQYRTMLAA